MRRATEQGAGAVAGESGRAPAGHWGADAEPPAHAPINAAEEPGHNEWLHTSFAYEQAPGETDEDWDHRRMRELFAAYFSPVGANGRSMAPRPSPRLPHPWLDEAEEAGEAGDEADGPNGGWRTLSANEAAPYYEADDSGHAFGEDGLPQRPVRPRTFMELSGFDVDAAPSHRDNPRRFVFYKHGTDLLGGTMHADLDVTLRHGVEEVDKDPRVLDIQCPPDHGDYLWLTVTDAADVTAGWVPDHTLLLIGQHWQCRKEEAGDEEGPEPVGQGPVLGHADVYARVHHWVVHHRHPSDRADVLRVYFEPRTMEDSFEALRVDMYRNPHPDENQIAEELAAFFTDGTTPQHPQAHAALGRHLRNCWTRLRWSCTRRGGTSGSKRWPLLNWNYSTRRRKSVKTKVALYERTFSPRERRKPKGAEVEASIGVYCVDCYL